MVTLMSLWLPILLAAVIVFAASSVMHMVVGHHAGDYAQLPGEDAVLDALRKFNIPPGEYVAPRAAGMSDMKNPAYLEKRNRGPVVMMTVLPNGPVTMGASLMKWFVFSIVINVFAAYIATHALKPGAMYLEVFRYVGAVTFIGYSLALWQDTIWYSRKASTTVKYTMDGLVYALLTAGTFGWLWPK